MVTFIPLWHNLMANHHQFHIFSPFLTGFDIIISNIAVDFEKSTASKYLT